MTIKQRVALVVSFSLATVSSFAGVEGVVVATRLNVRVRPGTKYTQVAQLKKETKVAVLRHKDGWYEISAPSDAKVWISSLFIDD
ncbi:MAG: SH3 domain-containing protein, partial [Kiritimatiellaeota bacterium]|nr:SH3 domain-containing protein [Kiritimatiellota bacterium]